MNLFQQILTYITAIFLAVSPTPQYVEGVIGQPTSFLPSQLTQENDKAISKLIFRGLFTYDIYGVLVPDLAETWTVSEDGLAYTIKIRDNQYWNNGKKITSDDLIYSAFKIEDLVGVATDKVDELTVRYTLPNKYSPFLSLLTAGVMQVNEEDRKVPLRPVSSSDFEIIQVERTGNIVNRVILRSKNPEHKVKRIVFRYYANEDELVTAAKLGEIDSFLAKDNHELENFSNYKFPLQGIYYALIFNTRNETLKDVGLRQKLQKVLPVESLISEYGILAQGPISRSVFTDKDLEFDPYDEHFKEDLGDVKLTLTIPNTDDHLELAKRIADIWKNRLEVKVEIRQVSPNDMLESVIKPRDFEVFIYGQEVGRDPDRYVYWHSTQKDYPSLNISGFEQVRADRALEEGRNEQDNDKRILHYNEFQKVVTEQVPAIFLYHPYTNFYVSKYIKGIGDKYSFTYSNRFLDFYNWEKIQSN